MPFEPTFPGTSGEDGGMGPGTPQGTDLCPPLELSARGHDYLCVGVGSGRAAECEDAVLIRARISRDLLGRMVSGSFWSWRREGFGIGGWIDIELGSTRSGRLSSQ